VEAEKSAALGGESYTKSGYQSGVLQAMSTYWLANASPIFRQLKNYLFCSLSSPSHSFSSADTASA
jgi:hypothetical protein